MSYVGDCTTVNQTVESDFGVSYLVWWNGNIRALYMIATAEIFSFITLAT